MLFFLDFKLILLGIAHLQVLSFYFILFCNLYYTPFRNVGGISECRAFVTVIYCAISWVHFHFIWYHVVILFGNVFKNWKECHLVQQRWLHMDNQSAMMTLIALSAWSYCMNLSQPPVDILFAVHVYFSQWIVVSAIYCWLYFP